MPFIQNSTTFFSFAEYSDVFERDQRVFEANEGVTEEIVEDLLVRSTSRILTLLKDSDWWHSLYSAPVPNVDPFLIKDRQQDFTDLCVFHVLYYYLLPKIADFSDETNAERQKIEYYENKFDVLLAELITFGDWYDFDESDVITLSDHNPGLINPRRIR